MNIKIKGGYYNEKTQSLDNRQNNVIQIMNVGCKLLKDFTIQLPPVESKLRKEKLSFRRHQKQNLIYFKDKKQINGWISRRQQRLSKFNQFVLIYGSYRACSFYTFILKMIIIVKVIKLKNGFKLVKII
ncbi:unnamed protein product [Paramecium sonneborni]|uniref:Uncharacterized protein n=1 Tax=Paramecium sonneborni TaxID=65129 RepID=A0A8S1LD75_9CILI|nr:unnamed protein product [Paramecium sonneborni]